MKCKVYAERIIQNLDNPDLDKVIVGVFRDLMAESQAIIHQRHCVEDAAYVAVFDEFDNRWITICRIVNSHCGSKLLNPLGFREILIKEFTERGIPVLQVWHPRKISL